MNLQALPLMAVPVVFKANSPVLATTQAAAVCPGVMHARKQGEILRKHLCCCRQTSLAAHVHLRGNTLCNPQCRLRIE